MLSLKMKKKHKIFSLTFITIMSIAMADQSNDLWGPIDISKWEQTPFLSGRVATEEDVKKGVAVFYISESDDLKPIDIALPSCAILIDQEENKETPVIIIQAEKSQGQEIIGYRFISGGNGISSRDELIFLEKPNEAFK